MAGTRPGLHMDERDEATEADARESGALLFIGLIVLLIGFFVVLNHASNMAGARSRAVMGSVASTFSAEDPEAKAAHAFTADVGDVLQNGTFSVRLGKLVTTAFPLAKVDGTAPGAEYQVTMPLTSMWLGDAETPSTAGTRFIAQTAALLAAPPPDTSYRVAAWLDDSATGAKRALAVRRISGLADALVAAGAPATAVESGLARGRAILLRLVFTVHSAAAAVP